MNTTNTTLTPNDGAKERILSLIANIAHQAQIPIDSMAKLARMLAETDDIEERKRLIATIEKDYRIARQLLTDIQSIVKNPDGQAEHYREELSSAANAESIDVAIKAEKAATDEAQDKEEQQKKIILVAEDNNSNFILDLMILRKDYEVIHAWNGAEAVEMVQKTRPDLVLMDIKMPVMNGYEAFDKIKAIDPTIPIIAITAYSLAEEEHKIIEKGFDAYLFKPLSAEEFSRTINSKVKE